MWTGPSYQTYYLHIARIVRERLDKEDPDYLLQVDINEYLDYLVEEGKWEPLTWDESGKTVERFSIKRQRRGELGTGTYQVDEERLRLRIPISKHPQRADYFKFQPSTRRGSEPDWEFKNDTVILEVEATERAIERGIDDVRFWLGNRNNEIETGNKQLRDRIKPVWETKRKQLEETRGATTALLEKLNIPLHQDPNARVRPIEIKPRQLRTVIEKPKPRSTPEPTLNREDVTALVEFIEQYARQFEVTPRTYEKMKEEELRDLLVGMMNANYPGSATGETFSKLGKTDISLRVESGNVLICECKFWSGAKAYGDALDQLFRYLTWHQNYGVLLHFCKLKDMTQAVAAAQRACQEHPFFTQGSLHATGQTRFSTRHVHPQDTGKLAEVSHLFVDLSV
ncbi:MAG: hypothetical protein HQ548_01880 [Chloroflexi bacterium]|nr:hypothetical protein [Chloroflexota bacterium]